MKQNISAKTKVIVALLATTAVIGGGYLLYNLDGNETIAAAEADQFSRYCAKYGKSYATVQEFNLRKDIYNRSMLKAHQWNSKKQSHKLGENFFTDHTEDELKKLTGLKLGKRTGKKQ